MSTKQPVSRTVQATFSSRSSVAEVDASIAKSAAPILFVEGPSSLEWSLRAPSESRTSMLSTSKLSLRGGSSSASLRSEQPVQAVLNRAGNLLQALKQCIRQAQSSASNKPLFASLAASLQNAQRRSRKTQHPPCAHNKDLRSLFKEFDTESKGYLDLRAMRTALSQLGLPCGRDYLESLMKQYDANHDGRIDFSEFEAYVEHRQKDMASAFDQLDADTSGQHLGTIDAQTLMRVLRKAGLPATVHDAEQMIGLLDKDHDGVISYQEFCRFSCLLPAAQVEHHNILFDWVDSSDWIANMEYRLSMIPPKSSYQRLLAGGVAGAISRTVVAPFERLRTILMTEASMSLPEACKLIYQQNGITGFWRGNMLTVLKTMPQSAIQFAAYDGTKDALLSLFPRHDKAGLSQFEKVFSGCIAGASAILCTYPMEVMRTRAAVAGGTSSIPGAVRQIWSQQGIGGFYQGLKCGLLCEMMSVGLGFWAYELGQTIFREMQEGRAPTPQERGFIGGFSAISVMTATMPLETCVRRLQIQGHPGRPVLYRNTWHCFSTILEKEGFRAFYRGLLSSFMKVGPSIGVTYALYALLVQNYGIGGIRSYSHLNEQDEAALAAGKTEMD